MIDPKESEQLTTMVDGLADGLSRLGAGGSAGKLIVAALGLANSSKLGNLGERLRAGMKEPRERQWEIVTKIVEEVAIDVGLFVITKTLEKKLEARKGEGR